MHSGCQCHHNQCTDYKSFAKRNISHQFKSSINSLTIGYLGLPIFFPIVALGFGRAKFLFGGRRPSWPPELRPCRNRLKTLSAAVNAAQRATRILLKRGETKIIFAQKLSNLGLVLNKLMQLERVTDRSLGVDPPNTGQCLRFYSTKIEILTAFSSPFALFEAASITKVLKFRSHFKDLNCLTPLALTPLLQVKSKYF